LLVVPECATVLVAVRTNALSNETPPVVASVRSTTSPLYRIIGVVQSEVLMAQSLVKCGEEIVNLKSILFEIHKLVRQQAGSHTLG
jgi:hypothetical protein